MKRNITLISGIVTGFITLLVLGHFAGIEIENMDVLMLVSLLLTSISATLLLTDKSKRKSCEVSSGEKGNIVSNVIRSNR